jgi:hypothetical protein
MDVNVRTFHFQLHSILYPVHCSNILYLTIDLWIPFDKDTSLLTDFYTVTISRAYLFN